MKRNRPLVSQMRFTCFFFGFVNIKRKLQEWHKHACWYAIGCIPAPLRGLFASQAPGLKWIAGPHHDRTLCQPSFAKLLLHHNTLQASIWSWRMKAHDTHANMYHCITVSLQKPWFLLELCINQFGSSFTPERWKFETCFKHVQTIRKNLFTQCSIANKCLSLKILESKRRDRRYNWSQTSHQIRIMATLANRHLVVDMLSFEKEEWGCSLRNDVDSSTETTTKQAYAASHCAWHKSLIQNERTPTKLQQCPHWLKRLHVPTSAKHTQIAWSCFIIVPEIHPPKMVNNLADLFTI